MLYGVLRAIREREYRVAIAAVGDARQLGIEGEHWLPRRPGMRLRRALCLDGQYLDGWAVTPAEAERLARGSAPLSS